MSEKLSPIEKIRKDYNPEQLRILYEITGLCRKLQEVEELKKTKYNSPLCTEDALDSAIADISLDSYPSYDDLEDKLKKAVTKAKTLGLGKDPLITTLDKIEANSRNIFKNSF